MGKLKKEQEAILAQIDAIITMLQREEWNLDIFDDFDISLSPIDLLLFLLKKFGVDFQEIVDWIAQYIQYATPIIEIAIKGIILAKLKTNLDCNIDPRIPQYLREEIGGVTMTPFFGLLGDESVHQKDGERGLEIDLNTIDYYGVLNYSPMSSDGRNKYFGTNVYYTIPDTNRKFYSYSEIVEYAISNDYDTSKIKKTSEVDSMYELVRAKDMNAFLWFVKHKARFLNVSNLQSEGNILSVIEEKDPNRLVAIGEAFTKQDGTNESNVIGLCIKYNFVKDSKQEERLSSTSNSGTEVSNTDIGNAIYENTQVETVGEYTIVPTTNIWNGCNWYVNRSLYLDFYDKKERDYSKEFALFRLIMKTDGTKNTNKLQFTIKPAPNVIVPHCTISPEIEKVESKTKFKLNFEGDLPHNFHRLVFNSNGEREMWGKYSVVVGDVKENDVKGWRVYEVLNPNISKDTTEINPTNNSTGVELHVNHETREYKLIATGRQDIKTVLYECYPGFTVYEFNYDFIMGMRFFDASIIVAKLIEGVTYMKLDMSYHTTYTDYQMRISEIVKKQMEEYNYVGSDCFYTFSNAEFNAMQEKSELKRANLYPFQNGQSKGVNAPSSDEVYSILNEMNNGASQEENISVITRAITQATASITDEVLPEEKRNFEYDLMTKYIEVLTATYVEALLTPKLLMVFYVNQKIMGEDDGQDWTIEYLLTALGSLIIAIVDEFISVLTQKLLEFVMTKFQELLLAAAKLLLMEQVEYYARLIAQMIKACTFRLPSNPNLASTLDYVDYADIDPNESTLAKEC